MGCLFFLNFLLDLFDRVPVEDVEGEGLLWPCMHVVNGDLEKLH